MVLLALACAAVLIATAALALAIQEPTRARQAIYGICLIASSALLVIAVLALLGIARTPSTAILPLGIPWLGARFRLDALSAFFLAVVALGAAAASLFALGYGRHEAAPRRVLPFYPAFLAGMCIVVLADDAFTFLVSWEFMSLSSWALVMAHQRVPDNVRAGYVYLIMASFGTLALLLMFGLFAGPDGGYAFADMRAARAFGRSRGRRSRPCPDRRRFQSRSRAAACLVAARASGRAEPRLGADERRDDQGRRLRLRAHRIRSARNTRLVVEHGGACAWRHHRRDGRALRPDAARPQTAARIPHGGEHRDHLHRARPRARIQGPWHGAGGGARPDGRPAARFQSFDLQKSSVLRRRRGAYLDRRARHGAPRRPHPSHAPDRLRLPGRLRGDLGAAAAQRLRFGMVDLPGDLAQPADSVLGTQAAGAGGRRAAGALGGTCRRLLRQSIRRDLSRPRAHAGGRAGAGNRPVFAGGDVLVCRALPGRRCSARLLHRCAGARGARPGGRSHAGAKRRRMALDRADRRKPQLL